MPPEARLVKRIQTYLSTRGARSFKIVGQDEGYQEAGIPDLLVCYRGFFVGIEVKQPGEVPKPRQLYVLDSIADAGGKAAWVHSVEEVEELLSELDRKEVI